VTEYRVIEDIPKRRNCSGRDLKKGEILYEYTKYTYGCISPTGIAATFKPGKEPFFEVPRIHVKLIDWKVKITTKMIEEHLKHRPFPVLCGLCSVPYEEIYTNMIPVGFADFQNLTTGKREGGNVWQCVNCGSQTDIRYSEIVRRKGKVKRWIVNEDLIQDL